LELDDREFFGEFTIDPQKTLRELGQTYEIDAGNADPETPIASFIERRLGGRTEVGDRVACGSVELVVREVDEAGAIKSVGLAIQPQPLKSARIPLFLNARQILARLRGVRGASDRKDQSD
jgi:potassium/hydrogen antiporter